MFVVIVQTTRSNALKWLQIKIIYTYIASIFNVVYDYRLDNQGSISGRDKGFFL
jgi:hypothetical protein